MILSNLMKEPVFEYFEKLCAIPHGSGNTKAISDFCVNFAKERGLWCAQDELNNVIIKKPASKGYENHAPVILQGHLDMVCEKDADCDIDFAKDGLSLGIDGDFIFAHGTTLGGDDGIAVAMVLAILDDNTLSHPPIEAVFTVDEETGMYGAAGLDVSCLSSRTLINIDSEDEGVFTVSCAGGARCAISLPLKREEKSREAFELIVSGLIGGHSGVEINKGRLNANVVTAKLLAFLSERFDISLVSINGGSKDNVITRECCAVICTDASLDELLSVSKEYVKSVAVESDPDLKVEVKSVGLMQAITSDVNAKVLELFSLLPQGVIKMSEHIQSLPETSLNLGVASTTEDMLKLTYSVRSCVNKNRDGLLLSLNTLAERLGAEYSQTGVYPAWEYREESRLRDVMCEVYEEQYGKKPVVEAIHAGLECGLFCDKIPDLDAVSFGPDLFDIHTSRERMSISSVKRTYHMLTEILRRL